MTIRCPPLAAAFAARFAAAASGDVSPAMRASFMLMLPLRHCFASLFRHAWFFDTPFVAA